MSGWIGVELLEPQCRKCCLFSCRYEIVLDTDSKYFGGLGRTQSPYEFNTLSTGFDKRPQSLRVILSCVVKDQRNFSKLDSCKTNTFVISWQHNVFHEQRNWKKSVGMVVECICNTGNSNKLKAISLNMESLFDEQCKLAT